ncbi:flagellar assembly protein H [Iodobacter sp. HSC-16F04]|uniref:Flagellar assembly protein FliH n=1 Tax=Iodobacter violaceini TaxID=3044271 RepID=A0ABX0KSG7_9NEIS|nr:flagellar assembly protein FliH [Iodobacter violacea]NHQ86882.1 flagellar assembly protein H [Iodobacter violacea]
MKSVRPHRFPSLQRLQAQSSHAGEAAPLSAEAYQQGWDSGHSDGHAEGLISGEAAGFAEGHAAGLAQGEAEARLAAAARFDEKAALIEQLLQQVQRASDDYQLALRQEVVDLVARVARQVIRCELTLQPVQLLALVDETLAATSQTNTAVAVHLNAEECQRVIELAPERVARWQLVADPHLAPGECRIHSAEMEADAGCMQRLDLCMDQLKEQLLTDDAAKAEE